MFYFFIQNQNSKKTLIDKVGFILDNIKKISDNFPNDSWQHELELFLEDLNIPNQGYLLDDRIDNCYREVLLNFLDFGQLDNLSKKIKEILDKSQDKIGDLQKLSSDISSEYSKFIFDFQILSSAWLYHQPEILFANQEKFNLIFDKFEKTQAEKNSLIRYLSQSLRQDDFSAADWALEYLNKTTFLETNAELFTQVSNLTALFLVFKDFSYFSFDNQKIILRYYLIDAIRSGLPVEEILGRRLGEAADLNAYIVYSGQFSQSLENSPSLFLPSDNFSVQDLLKDYLEFYQNENKPEQAPQKFLSTWLRNNPKFKDFSKDLEKILEIYTNLRECILIDYNGLLSDEGEMPKFDWLQILNSNTEELSPQEIAKVRDYLALIDRPIRMKIEIVAAIIKINWQDQKFLSKILQLSEIYEDVYGDKYGQLVFFDETEMGWKLNKNLPSLAEVIK